MTPRHIVVTGVNNANWLVWNPDVVKTPVCRTLGADEWKRFYCIEPCTLTPQLLKPGETRAHGMTLRVDRPLTSD